MSGPSEAPARPLPERGLSVPALRPLPARGAVPTHRPLPARGPLPARASGRGAWVANATLVGRDDLTAAIAIFRVRPDDGPPAFLPGQYLSVGLVVDGAVVQRPYSTASGPGSAELEFLIRRVPGGTFTPALWAARPGARVSLGRAKGVFALRPDDDRAHLFIATGTGLAPFVAMLGAMGDRPRRPGAVVVHGVAHVAELAYGDRLAAAHRAGGVRYVPTISRPADPGNAGWSGASGRVTEVLPRLFADGALDSSATVAYLCGNPAMIESATALLADLGLPPGAIVSERYWASDPAGSPART